MPTFLDSFIYSLYARRRNWNFIGVSRSLRTYFIARNVMANIETSYLRLDEKIEYHKVSAFIFLKGTFQRFIFTKTRDQNCTILFPNIQFQFIFSLFILDIFDSTPLQNKMSTYVLRINIP